jgi:hypothetical protein
MNNEKQFDTTPDRSDAYIHLARWLQYLFSTMSPGEILEVEDDNEDEELEQAKSHNYHPQFYRQLPDFVMALLSHTTDAASAYAPLLYHLAGCAACRSAYLEFYRALQPVIETGTTIPTINNATRPLSAMPGGSLVHLCQTLIDQAETVLRQDRRTSSDNSAYARSLLRMAIRFSTQIGQSMMRRRALQDLVRVATLFDGPQSPGEQPPAIHSYEPLVGAAGPRHGGKVIRRGETALRTMGTPTEPSASAIYLHASQLEGSITQQGDLLELHLHDLDNALRGHILSITIPLGSLLEPVRWLGGNPRAIRSAVPVDQHGDLTTPIGHTDLRLTNPDEHNLLEAMFLLLEVRAADEE